MKNPLMLLGAAICLAFAGLMLLALRYEHRFRAGAHPGQARLVWQDPGGGGRVLLQLEGADSGLGERWISGSLPGRMRDERVMVLVNRDFPDAPVELSEPRGNGLILWFAGAGIFTALGLVWIAFWVPSLRTAAAEERRYLNMGGAEDDW